MKPKPRKPMLPILLIGLLAGCGKGPQVLGPSGPSATDQDQAEISSTMGTVPELVEDGAFEREEALASGLSAPESAGPADGTSAAIEPLGFWRRITSVERRFEFEFRDEDPAGRPQTAIVTIHKQLRGTFNILVEGPKSSTEDVSRLVIHKRLADHSVRRILLKRVPALERQVEPEFNRPRWRVAATSGVQVTSLPRDLKDHAEIVSLRVKTADLDVVITDPLAFIRLRQILQFQHEEKVELTVTTKRADDVVVLLRAGGRLRFTNNGDNTYTGVWTPAALRGVAHFGVNALSHDTLYDDEAPYNSQAWILPYVIRPCELAEYMP